MDYEKAIKYYEKNLNIINDAYNKPDSTIKEFDYKTRASLCYLSLGIASYDFHKYTSAIEYFKKSIDICIDIRDMKGVAKGFSCLGGIYCIKGYTNLAIRFF